MSHERVPGTPRAPDLPRARRGAESTGRRRLALPGRIGFGQVAIVVALLAAVGAGFLGLRSDRSGDEPALVGEVIAIPGGELRVDAVRQWNESQHTQGMPGMPIPDPLPKGYRRFWTDVTLYTADGPGIPYRPGRFTVSGDGLGPVEPHSASEGLDTVRPNAQATITLLFQVPKSSGDLLLQLDGVDRQVLLPGPGTAQHGHDER